MEFSRVRFRSTSRGYWVGGQADIGHPLFVSSLGGAFMDIAQLLTFSVKQGASDLHLSAGVEPMIRVDGDVKRINLPALEHKNVHDMVYDIMNDKQRKAWDEFLETDFSFEIPGLARFRVNVFTTSSGAVIGRAPCRERVCQYV